MGKNIFVDEEQNSNVKIDYEQPFKASVYVLAFIQLILATDQFMESSVIIFLSSDSFLYEEARFVS